MNFVELWIKGEVEDTEMHLFIDSLRKGDGPDDMGLHTYLGFTWEQFKEMATIETCIRRNRTYTGGR